MNIKKPVISICLAATMASVTVMPAMASPEFSRSTEEWARLRDNTLEYEELEGLIQEYNTTVRNNRVALSKETARSAEDFADRYWDAADQAYDTAAEADGAAAITAEISARNAELNAEQNTKSIETERLGYEKAEKSLVMEAQTLMNHYYQQQQQLEILKKKKELAGATLQAVQTKLSKGMATTSEVLTAQQSVQSLEGQIIEQEGKISGTRQKLCVMTGWAADASPEIKTVPAADVNRIAAMNLEVDTAKALEQDYTLRINQQKLKNATSTENKELLNQTIANDKQQVAVAVNTAYQSVLQAKAVYDQANLNLDLASKNLNAANTKYQLGTISRLDVLQAQMNQVSAQAEQNNSDLALFQAMETYDWIVKGVRG